MGRDPYTRSIVWDELASHAELPFAQARMLPLEAYRSDAVHAVELRELFARDWLCVGRTADIAEPGDYLTTEVPVSAGDPGGGSPPARSIIVLRDGDGAVQAFDNVCVHRGARLLEGCGTGADGLARITCPYHAWTYRLDGSLIGGPYMQGSTEADGGPFDPDAHRLAPIRTEVWQGFIFITLDADASPLGPRLAGLTEVVERYDMAGFVPVRREVEVWETNWKLLVENFMDAYHVFKVHADSFGADGDNTLDTQMYPGTLDWAHHRVFHESGPELAAATNTTLTGDWRKTLVLAAVFPSFVIQLQPDWLWWLQITPVGTGRVRIVWQLAVHPATLAEAPDASALTSGLSALIDQVNGEDRPIVVGLRRNVDRPQFERAPLSWLERNVYDFDRYVATRLSGGPFHCQ